MNKFLLAGCAAAALSLGAGMAAAEDFKVTLSGEAKFQAYAVSQDKDTGMRSTDFRNRFRFDVNPEAVGLNGALTYGAKVKVKNEDSDAKTSFENNYIYASGAFGKVYFGNLASFNDDNGGVTRPASFLSEDDGFLGVLAADNAAYGSGATQLEAFRWKTATLGDQATKFRYDTPFMAGIKVGVGYTPSSSGSVDAWGWQRSETRDIQDVFEIGVFFDSTDKSIADKFGGAVVKASLDYQTADNGLNNREDYDFWQAGLNVGYAGFTFGGHYVYQGESNLLKTDVDKTNAYSYGVGAQYETGPWKMGIGYNYAVKDASYSSSMTGKKTSDYVSAGVMYNVAKGLDVSLDYAYVQTENTAVSPKNDDNANVFGANIILGF